jgi:eukaryotic-like serine/threonine-protein kinase
MHLEPGTRVGPYEIVAPLGAGGMGEVYRARDTKLSRDVAIKVLPALFGLDPDRSARFKREALALASLNHPHVATVYGLEDAAGEPAIAMELVEGPSLADRLAPGPLPVNEALALARQIAEGLAAAHARGIVHRDLKPHNIKLTSDGSVKLLDFGLAKIGEPLSGSGLDAASDSPTITGAAATSMGTLLGTAAYMAPEQARGQDVDHRVDIWAYGCVLFEMLTGRRVFAGGGTTDVLAAILQTEPDWSRLPAATPSPVRRLLRRCLQKSVDRRLHSVRDAILEIDDAISLPADDNVGGVRPRRLLTLLPWLVAAAAVLALGLSLTRSRTAPSTGPSKLTVALPHPLADTGRPLIALSPDGSRIAFVAQHDDSTAVYARPVDGFESTVLPGTQGATSLLFSPDGEWIAFYSGSRLRKVSVRGGPPVVLAEMTDFMGASWSGNSIVASTEADLLSVPAEGGEAKSLLTSAESKSAQVERLLPHFLPGGEAVLLTLARPQEMQGSVAVRVLKTGEERVLVRDATQASYFDGWLTFARSGTLFAVPFDLQRLATTGTPVPVLQGVMFNQSFGTTQYSVAANGTLAHVTGPAGERRLLAADRNGATSAVSDLRRAYYLPRVSPDGGRLALTILDDGAFGVWMTQSLDGAPVRIAENSFDPVWSPDGRSMAFATSRDGGMNLAVARLYESTPPKTIFVDNAMKVPTSWTPDGKSIVFTRVDPDGSTGEDVYIIGADGTGVRPLVQTAANESGGVVSPDGRWLAFSTSGGRGVVVAVGPVSDPARHTRVAIERCAMPVWSRGGRELFFLSGQRFNRMMVMEVSAELAGVRLGKPRFLFEQNIAAGIGYSLARFDVMPGDQRFIFVKAEDAAPASEIRLTLDWGAQLRRSSAAR